jgi:hypothetical protein
LLPEKPLVTVNGYGSIVPGLTVNSWKNSVTFLFLSNSSANILKDFAMIQLDILHLYNIDLIYYVYKIVINISSICIVHENNPK